MQSQLARYALVSRACSNVAACMPSLSVSLSTLSFYPSDTSRPTETPNFSEGLAAVQPPSWHHMSQRTLLTDVDRHSIDRQNYAMEAVQVRPQTGTPWMPAQLQAADRLAQVQKLASIGSVLPGLLGLEGELPQILNVHSNQTRTQPCGRCRATTRHAH